VGIHVGKHQDASQKYRLSVSRCASREWFAMVTGVAQVATIFLCILIGCGPSRTPYPESLNSQRPEERILAAKRAADIHDRDVIGILVDRLEDDDEAVRMFAILALEKLTGTRNGYDYSDDPSQRARAVKRWRRDLSQQCASSAPSPGGAQR